jgi:hypothetical protein
MKRRLMVLSLIVLVFGLLVLGADPRAPQAQQFGGTTYCNASKVYDASTNGSTVLVASSSGAGGSIYICGYTISSAAAVNVKLIYGTGTTCGTGTTALTPAYNFQAVTTNAVPNVSDSASNWRGMTVPAGNDLCINTSAGNSVQAIVYFYQQR